MMRFLLLMIILSYPGIAWSQEILDVYGPGGPAPAMKAAAAAFTQKTGIPVKVTAGPTTEWLEEAKTKADPTLGDFIPLEKEYAVHRSTAIAPTLKGQKLAQSQAFIAFLQSPDGAAIFQQWGWKHQP
jgi:accessory colonization factor AcfC